MTGSEKGSGLCCCKLLWYNVVDATLGDSMMPCRDAMPRGRVVTRPHATRTVLQRHARSAHERTRRTAPTASNRWVTPELVTPPKTSNTTGRLSGWRGRRSVCKPILPTTAGTTIGTHTRAEGCTWSSFVAWSSTSRAHSCWFFRVNGCSATHRRGARPCSGSGLTAPSPRAVRDLPSGELPA
jgi:hypothetical protein